MPPTTTDWCTLEHACTGGGVGGQHVWSLVDCEQDSRAEISPLIEVTLNSSFGSSSTLPLQEYVSDHTHHVQLYF